MGVCESLFETQSSPSENNKEKKKTKKTIKIIYQKVILILKMKMNVTIIIPLTNLIRNWCLQKKQLNKRKYPKY